MYKNISPRQQPNNSFYTMAAKVEVSTTSHHEELMSVSSSQTSPHLSLASTVSADAHDEVPEAQAFLNNLTEAELSAQSDKLVDDMYDCIARESQICFLPNYNISPTGNEQGKFLAIDLGGSTLRVATVVIDPPSGDDKEVRASRIHNQGERSWIVPNHKKIMNWAFFQFVGARVKEMLEENGIDLTSTISTGITWSFPLETTKHNRGRICVVSKGYTIGEDIFGRDLKDILEQVMKEDHGISIDIKAILNDSLAVYAAGLFSDPYMRLAMVLGTGTNMCCALNATSTMPESKKIAGESQILYNTEFSMFGDTFIGQVTNEYDAMIHARYADFSPEVFVPYLKADPRTGMVFQPTEMLTSGRYVPELARLVVHDLVKQKRLFAQVTSSLELLSKPYEGLSGQVMRCIDDQSFPDVVAKLAATYSIAPQEITRDDVVTLKVIVGAIIKRAAFVVASMTVAFIKIITKQNQEHFDHNMVNVGYIGSVLEHFDNYRHLVHEYVNENPDIKKLGLKVHYNLIDNSSINGAAIAAAYYS
ncbi:N-acetylglucosamine kinase 1 [Diutina catenulata]